MKNGNEVVPTTTAAPARVRLFQATQRPTVRGGDWITTSWGRCRVHGRLGQRHADIIESMLYAAERRRDTPSGGLELLVDPAKVRRVLSDAGYSHARLWSLLRECMQAVVEIEAGGMRALGHVIDEIVESPMTRPHPRGGERHLWRVRVGSALRGLLQQDMGIRYDPAPVARLQFGVSQAVTRLLLTHSQSKQPNGGWRLDGLLEAVGVEQSPDAMKKARHLLRTEAAALSGLGIEIDGDRVRLAA